MGLTNTCLHENSIILPTTASVANTSNNLATLYSPFLQLPKFLTDLCIRTHRADAEGLQSASNLLLCLCRHIGIWRAYSSRIRHFFCAYRLVSIIFAALEFHGMSRIFLPVQSNILCREGVGSRRRNVGNLIFFRCQAASFTLRYVLCKVCNGT